MFRRICLIALAATASQTVGFSTISGGSHPSQDEAQATATLPNAAALVRKALRATGELTAIEKTSARTLTGTIQLPGQEEPGTIRIVQARPDLFLQSSSMPGVGDVQIGHDGKTTWMVHPDPAIGANLLDGIIAAQERVRNAYDFGLHTRKHVRSMETVARKPFDGRECFEVRCELNPFVADGKVLDLEATARYRTFTEYFEVDSGLLAGVDVVQASLQGDMSSTTIYRDYKELSPGVKVATSVLTRFNQQELVTTITALDFEPVQPTLFTPPAAIQKLIEAKAAAAASQDGEADDVGVSGDDDDEGGGGGGGRFGVRPRNMNGRGES